MFVVKVKYGIITINKELCLTNSVRRHKSDNYYNLLSICTKSVHTMPTEVEEVWHGGQRYL